MQLLQKERKTATTAAAVKKTTNNSTGAVKIRNAIDIPFGKRSFIRKVKTRAQTKNIVAIFRFNQKIIFRQNLTIIYNLN